MRNLRTRFEELIKQEPKLILDKAAQSIVCFGVKDWDVPILLQGRKEEGKKWTDSGRILQFYIYDEKEKLITDLFLGKVSNGSQETRQKLFDMAQKPPFNPQYKSLYDKHFSIYKKSFWKPKTFEEMSEIELEATIRCYWAQFLNEHLPEIDRALKKEQWIWSTAK